MTAQTTATAAVETTGAVMKKIFGVVAIGLVLAGCSPSYTDSTAKYSVLPDGLKDCKFYEVQSNNGDSMKVVRCPLSATTTTYSSGKLMYSTAVVEQPAPVEPPKPEPPKSVVVDGVTYTRP